MELNRARSILTVFDLLQWQRETREFLVNDEEFKECFNDPRRILNQGKNSLAVKSAYFMTLLLSADTHPLPKN